jgi:Kef-type K+ transport system membrane component KefB
MFFAGLEIDLALFKRARNRSIALGIATTVIPLSALRSASCSAMR